MDLSYALRVAVHQLHSRRVMFRPVHIPGFPTFPDRQSLVQFLAGPTPSGTPERAGQHYRSAARRIQRWERGEDVPNPQSTYQLDRFLQRLSDRKVRVRIIAKIKVSNDSRWRDWMSATVTEAELSDPVAFDRAFYDAYGINRGVVTEDVGELTAQYA